MDSLALWQNGDGRGALEGDGGRRGVDVLLLGLRLGDRVEEPATPPVAVAVAAPKLVRRGQLNAAPLLRALSCRRPLNCPRWCNHGPQVFLLIICSKFKFEIV